MAYELVYTSAPEGLNRGSSGFCVVACTKGLGPRLVVTLEGLSAYKPLYPHYASNAWDNPISRSHYIYEANGEQQHILSRICFNGVDHTQRSNKLASHLVLSPREAAIAHGGPTSLLQREELFKDASWHIQAEFYEKQQNIPETFSQIQRCALWETVTGDAGWGGYLAQCAEDAPQKNVYIIYRPEQNQYILPLLQETMSLLPEHLRWRITFNTYFVNLPAGMNCSWRCCTADSDAARAARRSPLNIIIDITHPVPLAQESRYITAARTGEMEQKQKIVPISTPAPATVKLVPKLAEPPQALQRTIHLELPKRPQPHKKAVVPYTPQVQNDTRRIYQPRPERSGHSRLAITIAVILLIVTAFAGGMFYFFSAAKAKQFFTEKQKECKQIENGLISIEKELSSADFDDLKERLETLKSRIAKLLPHQPLFAKEQLTPENLKNRYERVEKLIEQRKAAARQKAEETKQAKKKKDSNTPPKTPVIPSSSPKQNAKSSKKAAVPEPLPWDDPAYLWEKSPQFHQTGEVRLFVGEKAPNKLKIYLAGNNYPKRSRAYKVGDWMDAGYNEIDNQVTLKSTLNDKGELTFRSSNKPSELTEIFVESGNRQMPLFFLLGTSKLRPVSKQKENLAWTVENNKVFVKIAQSSFRAPNTVAGGAAYGQLGPLYDPNFSKCSRTSDMLCLQFGPHAKTAPLKLKGGVYQSVFPCPKAREITDEQNKLESLTHKLEKLKALKTKIEAKPESYFKMLLKKQEKYGLTLTEDEKGYFDNLEFVQQYAETVAKQLDKTKTSWADLRKAITECAEAKKTSLQKTWLKAYVSLLTAQASLTEKVLTGIPLKALGEKGDLSLKDTLAGTESQKKALEQRIEKIKNENRKTIEVLLKEAVIFLRYNSVVYEQFSVKEILP